MCFVLSLCHKMHGKIRCGNCLLMLQLPCMILLNGASPPMFHPRADAGLQKCYWLMPCA
jgi:hypothetical protein